MRRVLSYLKRLSLSQAILWGYLIWYLVMAGSHFDPSLALWTTSAGLSLVVGIALLLSVAPASRGRLDRWQTLRMFLVPFCVSSFSALVKDRGFILVFSPEPMENGLALLLCGAWALALTAARRFA